MATEIIADVQGSTEIRTHYIDFTNDLPTGVTVSSAAAVHTPPSGAAATPTVGTITAGVVPITIGPLAVLGRHVLTVTATLSNSDLSVARLIIPVEWDTARSGLTDLIIHLRAMANVGSNDYSVGGLQFWTDKQIQDALDRSRKDHYRQQLSPTQTYSGGTVVWKDYYIDAENIEKTTGGTSIFYLEDSAGVQVGTALYTVDYARGHVSFGADTGGSSYFWYGRSYDLNRAAADVWRQKASHYAMQFNFSTDNHRIDRGKVYEQCLAMADYYEQRSSSGAGQVVTIYRSDNYAE